MSYSEQIQVMTACGLSPRAIASELNLPLTTLTQTYKEDLEHGLEIANARVAKVFFDLATSGEHPALTVKWVELRANWASTQNLNVSSSDEEAEAAREKLLRLLNRSPSTPLKAVK